MHKIYRTSSLAGLVLALCLLAVMGPGPAEAGPIPIVVDTAADNGFPCTPGDCSIRGAIAAANSNAGFDTITFDPGVFPPGGGAPAIVLVGTLPALPPIDASGGITIDGTGADVRISGEFVIGDAAGFSFYSALGTPAINVTVRDIGLFYFAPEIYICGGGGSCQADVTNVDIEGVIVAEGEHVYIKGGVIAGVSVRDLVMTQGGSSRGLEVSGTNVSQVEIDDSSVTYIRVNGSGSVSDVVVTNNFLTLPANFGQIVVFGGSSVSDVSITDNSINAYLNFATHVAAPAMERIEVSRNFITTPQTSGILIGGEVTTSASDLTVSDNEISAPGTEGIWLLIPGVVDNLDISGNTIMGGLAAGMFIEFFAGTNNVIHDNTVFNNGADGIYVRSFNGLPQTRVRISHNKIFDNSGTGINLYKPGEATAVTLNDAGDADTGPNDLLNFPVITGEMGQAVMGTTCASCTVELFRADQDPSGYGEGDLWLKDATADGGGQFSIPICGVGLVPGDKVTATATDTLGNTSEFSLNHTIVFGSGACPTPTPTTTPSPTPTSSPTPTITSTASPTPTFTPTNTPTSTSRATPSATPQSTASWGDSDCDGEISSRDNQALLRRVLSQTPLSQTEPCPNLGDEVMVGGTPRVWGDWDCDGEVSSRDNQALLRRVLSQPPLAQTEPCPDIGKAVSI